jgi:hypothetical protein
MLGIGIVIFSTYQATIVPNQNAQAEFQHSQEVQSQMEGIRNAIVAPPPKGQSQSVKLGLGMSYTNRILGTNPGNPSGTIRTNGTDDRSIDIGYENADAVSGTPSYWERMGNEELRFNSGALVYEPNYNEHTAPTTVYENTLLFNEDSRSGRTTIADPSLVDENEINIIALTGDLLESGSGTAAFDVRTVDKSTETVKLTGEDENNPLKISFWSRQPKSYWEQLNEDSDNEKYIDSISDDEKNGGWYEISITFAYEDSTNEPITYDVTLANVSVDPNPPSPKRDGTKMSMVAHHNVTGMTNGFEEWSRHPEPTEDCGAYGDRVEPIEKAKKTYIGGQCQFSDGTTERNYFLPEGKYQVGFTYWSLQTWDGGEDGIAKWLAGGNDQLNWQEEYSGDNGESHKIVETVDHPGGEVNLQFTSSVDQGPQDESFAINDVWIRHMDDG